MKFRTEQKETEKLFTQITIDGKHERNKNYIKKDSSINEIITNFKAENVGRALEDLSLILSSYD